MRDSGILFSHQVNLTRKYSSYDSKSHSTDMVKLWPLPYGINTNHIVRYFKLLRGSACSRMVSKLEMVVGIFN